MSERSSSGMVERANMLRSPPLMEWIVKTKGKSPTEKERVFTASLRADRLLIAMADRLLFICRLFKGISPAIYRPE